MSQHKTPNTLKPSELSEGRHVCLSNRAIETKYGTSFVLKLACGKEVYSNQSLKDYIKAHAGKQFSFHNHGEKTFTRKQGGETITYVKICDFELV